MPHFQGAALRKALDGISGILVTPFDSQDRIVAGPLKPVVDRAVEAGVHVLVANGNTSEFYGLEAHEAEQMIGIAADAVAGRVPLLAGVGRSVHEACALARASRRAGADALMVHQPPDPFVAPRGVVRYLRQIAEAADGLPMVLYLRNDNIGLATIEELCRIPEIVGVKWASPTPLVLAEAIRRTADRGLAWVGGLAEVWAPPHCAVGARGFTSGLINVMPERSVAIYNALEASDYPLAMRLIGDMLPFEDLRAQENNGTNVTVVKTALQMMGHDCGATRAPSAWPLADGPRQQLQALMSGWGLLRQQQQPADAAAIA